MAYTRYSDDIEVQAPGRDGKGIFTFDGIILPILNSIKSVEDCYSRHKQDLLARIDSGQMMSIFYSPLFIDEAIYLNDAEMYPYFKYAIDMALKIYQKHVEERPDNKEYCSILHEWEGRRDAVCGDAREEYLGMLEKRKERNIQYLKKQLGIRL